MNITKPRKYSTREIIYYNFIIYYVYILKRINNPSRIYVGFTTNLEKRLRGHNESFSKHINKFKPWRIETHIAFNDKKLALKLKKYL